MPGWREAPTSSGRSAPGIRGPGLLIPVFRHRKTEMVIRAEIEHFTRLECAFEWKIYSHDEPPDLLAQLRKCGFGIGGEESVMVCDSWEVSPLLTVPLPARVTVTRVRDEGRIEDYLSVETAVWSCQPGKMRELLRSTLSDPFQGDLGFVAYVDEQPIGCGRVTASPQSRFAGLWGGSVLPDFRGQGAYRALLSARIDHIRQFDSIRYLRVDAMPTSRPILERYGFKRVASTWPAVWPPNGKWPAA
jgi:GNAT superfamily N-acetyltransferase